MSDPTSEPPEPAVDPQLADSRSREHSLTEWLALERTELANERTLLSWLRTGLGVGLAGATLLRFGGAHALDYELGIVAILAGVVLAIVGLLRYSRSRIRHTAWRRAWTRVGGQSPLGR